MRKYVIVFFAIAAVLVVVSVIALEYNFRPHTSYVIYEAYYKCETRKSLEGGIYGKGPFKSLGPRYCKGWVMTSRNELKQLASAWYKVRWDDEIEWWRKD